MATYLVLMLSYSVKGLENRLAVTSAVVILFRPNPDREEGERGRSVGIKWKPTFSFEIVVTPFSVAV